METPFMLESHRFRLYSGVLVWLCFQTGCDGGPKFLGHDQQYWNDRLSSLDAGIRESTLKEIHSGLVKDKPDEQTAIRVLTLSLNDDKAELRLYAAVILMRLHYGDVLRLVPIFKEALAQSPKPEARFTAAVELDEIAERVQSAFNDAMPQLEAGLTDPDKSLRFHCALAIGHSGIKSDALVKAMLRALGDSDSSVRIAATRALAEMCIPSTDIRAPLQELLKDPDEGVRNTAREIIKRYKA